MKTIINKPGKNEKGNALVIVLCFLAVGGLAAATLMTSITTGLGNSQRSEENTKLRYAADAGMEEVLWRLHNDQVPFEDGDYETQVNYALSDNVNGKTVNINIQQIWPLTGLESDEYGTSAPDALTITGGITNQATGRYKVQVSYDGSQGSLPIDKMAVWLPTRFQYVTGSSSGITTNNPAVTNQRGGRVLTWSIAPAVPFLDLPVVAPPGGGFNPGAEYPSTRALYFNVTPADDVAAGSYSWVRTTDTSLYLAWETTSTIVHVNSTATDNATGKSVTLGANTYFSEGASLGEGGIQVRGDYRAIGNTLMRSTDPDHPEIRDTLDTESSANVTNIPADAEVVLAYLYWSAWRDYSPEEPDTLVGLKVNGTYVYFDDQDNAVQGEPPAPATQTLRPNQDGDSSQLSRSSGSSSHYMYIDEAVANDATDFVYTTISSGKMDTYELPNLGQVVGTINSVTVYARARANGTSSQRLKIVANTHSNDYFGTTETMTGNAGWANYSKTWSTNPETGLAWTWPEIDDLQIGIKLYDDGSGQPECTQVYAEVNYVVPLQYIEASRWFLSDEGVTQYAYSAFKDVTDLVKLISPQGNATYTVAGVSGNTSNYVSYAGWSLIIIYSSPSETPHQIFLYDSFLHASSDSTHTFTIQGFEAPESPQATLTAFVGEGDELYGSPHFGTGYDYLKFNGTKLSDAVNPQNNVWNGQSSGLGGQVIDGVDIDTFNVSSPLILGGDTSAAVELGTGIDQWNLIYILLSFSSEFGGLTPNAAGVISYNYGGP